MILVKELYEFIIKEASRTKNKIAIFSKTQQSKSLCSYENEDNKFLPNLL